MNVCVQKIWEAKEYNCVGDFLFLYLYFWLWFGRICSRVFRRDVRQGSVSEWEIYDTSALSFTCPPPRVIYWILLIVSLYLINSYIISWLHLWQLRIKISTFLWLIDNECNAWSKVKLPRFNIHLKRHHLWSLQVHNQTINEVYPGNLPWEILLEATN